MTVYCGCGMWHEFEKDTEGHFFEDCEVPESINCSDCPICSCEEIEKESFNHYFNSIYKQNQSSFIVNDK